MSQQRELRIKGAAQGPYGPDNPPPPPPGPPPRLHETRGVPAQAQQVESEAPRGRGPVDSHSTISSRFETRGERRPLSYLDQVAARDREERSRSPGRPTYHDNDRRYRERTPPRLSAHGEYRNSMAAQGRGRQDSRGRNSARGWFGRDLRAARSRSPWPRRAELQESALGEALPSNDRRHGRDGRDILCEPTTGYAAFAREADQGYPNALNVQRLEHYREVKEVDWDDAALDPKNLNLLGRAQRLAPVGDILNQDHGLQLRSRIEPEVPSQGNLRVEEPNVNKTQRGNNGFEGYGQLHRQRPNPTLGRQSPVQVPTDERDDSKKNGHLYATRSRHENRVTSPPTAYSLGRYSLHVGRTHVHRKQFRQAYGKVAPTVYGSDKTKDLGLCFRTFSTRSRCEMRVSCPWRHHPLSEAEKSWIVTNDEERGRKFLQETDKFWHIPDDAFPGANMEGKED